jgi:hypothetical protein
MANLSDHIENALNETRMLLLGGQVLLGFSTLELPPRDSVQRHTSALKCTESAITTRVLVFRKTPCFATSS